MPSPLEGIRIVDLSTGPVGGVATMVLADFGAEVIKVEPPGGDRFRPLAAAPMWLRGKRSVVLDLPGAGADLERLVGGADVVVVSGPPARAARLGADAERLCAAHPSLVHCSISGWGPRGPWAALPGYEALVAAKAGRMQMFAGQRPRPGPAYAAVPVATHTTAQGAVQGIAAALIARERSGRGQRVETSLLQGLMPFDLVQLLTVQLAKGRPGAATDLHAVGGGMPTLNYHPVMTQDGRWIQLGNLLEHLFLSFLDAIDLLPELLADARFSAAPASWSAEAVEVARDRILTRMRERPVDEWMALFRENGNVAAEPWLDTQEALDHPELVANGDVTEHVHPELGPVRQLGVLARLDATPGRPGAAAPAVDADGEALRAEPPRPATAQPTSGAAPSRGRPLEGLTVVEFATIIAAPLGVTMLADLGARVIKVEAIGGDPYRHLIPGGLIAAKTNAGKESICLDLKRPEGRAIAAELIGRADALIHNFRPGVPERLGIDYARARSLRPDIVWVSANGYGPDAPGARRPSAHPVPGATMGGASYQAGRGMPPRDCASLADIREAARQLMKANEANPDPNTSVVIASATLLALLARARFGIGQPVYVNMLAANAYANSDDFLRYRDKPPRPEVDAEVLGLGPTYRLYPARSGWVFLALTCEAEWERFCSAVGRDDLAARGWRAAAADDLEALFRGRDADDWEKILTPAGVGCVRADGEALGAFLAGDDHVRENGFVTPARHARFGELRRWGPLVTCDGGAERYGPGVLAGEHTDVLLEELGYAAEQIASLREQGVVGSEPVDLD